MSTGPGLGWPDRANESPDDDTSGLGRPDEGEAPEAEESSPDGATDAPSGEHEPGAALGGAPSGHAMWGNTTSATAENVGYVPTNGGTQETPGPRKGPSQGESQLVREALKDANVSQETTVA